MQCGLTPYELPSPPWCSPPRQFSASEWHPKLPRYQSPNTDQREQGGELVGWLNDSGFADSGFVVSVFNADDQSLSLRWKNLSDEDRDAVLHQAQSLGVTVNFVAAKYSLPEIKAAQR